MKLNTALLSIFGVLVGALLISACTNASLAAQPTPTVPPTQAPAAPTQPPEVPTPQPTPAGDVYATGQDAGKTVSLAVGQTLVVTLEGNPTTGYNWYAVETENAVLEQVGEPVFSANTALLGSSGMISLVFRATAHGQQDLALAYERSFEKGVAPLKTFTMTVVVEAPQPTSAAPQATQTVIVSPAEGWKGWSVYTNEAYGFSFQYPPEWKVEDLEDPSFTLAGHAVWLTPDNGSNILLQIAFKRSSETITLGRTGVGSGDLVQNGTVMFLGQEVIRYVLVAQGKDYTVMYRQDGKIQRGNLEFTIDLDYRGLYTDPSALTAGIEANADAIVASVKMIGG
ncbi:MAG: protease inhibitor I42 family protein [Chloroflexi bacterium]|nr:protease inhibitor I42 family protein [Chloroflexota bacterium]